MNLNLGDVIRSTAKNPWFIGISYLLCIPLLLCLISLFVLIFTLSQISWPGAVFLFFVVALSFVFSAFETALNGVRGRELEHKEKTKIDTDVKDPLTNWGELGKTRWQGQRGQAIGYWYYRNAVNLVFGYYARFGETLTTLQIASTVVTILTGLYLAGFVSDSPWISKSIAVPVAATVPVVFIGKIVAKGLASKHNHAYAGALGFVVFPFYFTLSFVTVALTKLLLRFGLVPAPDAG